MKYEPYDKFTINLYCLNMFIVYIHRFDNQATIDNQFNMNIYIRISLLTPVVFSVALGADRRYYVLHVLPVLMGLL